MIAPTAALRTAVRATTVVTLTAGLLIAGVASAQAAAPVPPGTDAPSGLLGQAATILGGVLSGGGISTLLPNGILGG